MSPTQPPDHNPLTHDSATEDELIQRIGVMLIDLAPSDWRRIDLRATLATMVEDLALTAIRHDGTTPLMDIPAETKPVLSELRKRMFRPGLGTWFSMRMIIDPPGSYVTHFNFDYDPHWDPPIPPIVYQKDLESFPRDPDHTPSWLASRLAELPEETPGGIVESQ